MNSTEEKPGNANSHAGRFPATPWELVFASANLTDEEKAREALGVLLQTYWTPLYRFACQQGHPHHVAEDVTQSFIEHILSRNTLASVRQEKGRFRSFILSAFTHYLVDSRRAAGTARRGGSQVPLSLDQPSGPHGNTVDAIGPGDPSTQFANDWAWAVLRRALERLRATYARSGKLAVFERVRPRLDGSEVPARYADVGSRLALGESVLKVEVHRARSRLRKLVLEELGREVEGTAELTEELDFWKRALRGS